MKNDATPTTVSDTMKDSVKKKLIAQRATLQTEIDKVAESSDKLLKAISMTTDIEKHKVEAFLKGHMDRFHQYNDIKDLAQILLGRMAEYNSCTIKEMYKKYDLDFDD